MSTNSVNSGTAGEPAIAILPPGDGEVNPTNIDTTSGTLKINAVEIRNVIDGILRQVESSVDWDRGGFTKTGVATLFSRYPEFNWIMCHTSHSYIWGGSRGVDWEHWHHELDVYGAGTIGYEIYWARYGTFSLNGDGGFQNWAYIGNVQKINGGRILVFSPP
ncbi:hypothetical protein NLJ89_g5907 [Agrocybe chaxingu]|uniref:Uncharacterized protein n=1 Tax=Agrocybe chaxingu TaxID=84603 RepID=A0A9W8JZW7_9AGAR|nr:hypothetical protein NLJ89_g5907 [Agrocybe chaxingu]